MNGLIEDGKVTLQFRIARLVFSALFLERVAFSMWVAIRFKVQKKSACTICATNH